MDIPREKLLLMYERMLKIRHFETKVSELFATGDMPGFVHLCHELLVILDPGFYATCDGVILIEILEPDSLHMRMKTLLMT